MSELLETPEYLKERWRSGLWLDSITAIREKSAHRAQGIDDVFLRSLSLPDFSGRLDLRGIPFYMPWIPPIRGREIGPIRLKKIGLEDIDFSYSHIQFYALGMVFKNVLFNHSLLEGCYITRSKVIESQFFQASMPWLSLSGETSFDKCLFNETKIRHDASIAGHTIFRECSFRDIDWKMVEFGGCEIRNCFFSGKIEKSIISQPRAVSVRDLWRKLRCKTANTFVGCKFDNLKVKRLSIDSRMLSLINCSGFPVYTATSEAGRYYLDYYSNGEESKASP